VIMLDPNIRPGFITDEAAYRTRLSAIFAVADIIKVSDEDLKWLIPGPADIMSKLVQLQAGRQAVMILTCGKDGARALLPDGTDVAVSVPPAVVVDTVGAGDTFNAGVLAHLHSEHSLTKAAIGQLRGAHMTKALEFGAKVAAVTVARAGANPPWRHEISDA
jgi:fructokinase